MDGIEIWDIWFADVPFEDIVGSKSRPVLITNSLETYVLALKATSHEPRGYEPYDVPLRRWREAGLKQPTTVRVSKPVKLEQDQLAYKVGTLHPVDIAYIRQAIIKYKNSRGI